MKYSTSIITLTLLTLVFAGCSKHSPNTASTLQKDSGTQTTQETVEAQKHDTDTILPGPRMSQQQVIEAAWSQLPHNLRYLCKFKNGEWDILEVPEGVAPTNATRVVLRVRDTDGKVEPVQAPRG